MPIKQSEKKIGEAMYITTPFDPFEALGFQERMAWIFGPAISEAIGAGVEIKAMNMMAAAPAIEKLAHSIANPQFRGQFQQFCLDTLRNTTQRLGSEQREISGQDAFNEAFRGRLQDLYPVMAFVLQANDFFGFGGIMKAVPPSQKQNPPAA
jgi:hypothetical protein